MAEEKKNTTDNKVIGNEIKEETTNTNVVNNDPKEDVKEDAKEDAKADAKADAKEVKFASRAWFEQVTNGKTCKSNHILAACVDSRLQQEGDDFRNAAYYNKVVFKTTVVNAIGERESRLRSGWFNTNREIAIGEVVQIDLSSFVPVESRYIAEQGQTPVRDTETGQVKYITSSINFISSEVIKEQFKSGEITVSNGIFRNKFVLESKYELIK